MNWLSQEPFLTDMLKMPQFNYPMEAIYRNMLLSNQSRSQPPLPWMTFPNIETGMGPASGEARHNQTMPLLDRDNLSHVIHRPVPIYGTASAPEYSQTDNVAVPITPPPILTPVAPNSNWTDLFPKLHPKVSNATAVDSKEPFSGKRLAEVEISTEDSDLTWHLDKSADVSGWKFERPFWKYPELITLALLNAPGGTATMKWIWYFTIYHFPLLKNMKHNAGCWRIKKHLHEKSNMFVHLGDNYYRLVNRDASLTYINDCIKKCKSDPKLGFRNPDKFDALVTGTLFSRNEETTSPSNRSERQRVIRPTPLKFSIDSIMSSPNNKEEAGPSSIADNPGHKASVKCPSTPPTTPIFFSDMYNSPHIYPNLQIVEDSDIEVVFDSTQGVCRA